MPICGSNIFVNAYDARGSHGRDKGISNGSRNKND